MPTRQRQFPELVITRTAANARGDLDVYSKAEVDAEIAGVDLSAYTLTSTTASISGALNSDINSLETTVQDISGALSIDIENLDLSLTEKIAVDCLQSTGISGAGTVVTAYLPITVNGVTFKVALIN